MINQLMLEEHAKVVATEVGYVWVQTQRRVTCGHCASSQSCGMAALAKVLTCKTNQIRALSDIPLRVGDEVVIGIDSQSLVQGSLLVYILPIITMLMGSLTGALLVPGDEGIVVLCGFLGLAAGFVGLNYVSRKIGLNSRYQPVVLRQLSN